MASFENGSGRPNSNTKKKNKTNFQFPIAAQRCQFWITAAKENVAISNFLGFAVHVTVVR